MAIEDLPLPFQEYLRAVWERARDRLEAAIDAHGMTPGVSASVAAERIAILGQELGPVLDLVTKDGGRIACAKGCGFCCTLTIDVTPDEVFAVAGHLDRHLDPASLAAVKARAVAADGVLRGLSPVERHRRRIPCPVLDPATQSCLAHAARPNVCQGHLSVDLEGCKADHLDPPQPIQQPTIAPMIANLVDSTRSYAFADRGAPVQSLELIAGLLAAWADPEAEARWLAGAAVFEEASSAVAAPPSPG